MRREKRQVILFHKRAGQARSAHTGDTPVMLSILRKCIALFVYAAGLTYASLLVPGSVIAECANLGTPEYCPVLAYGFPLPFIADNQGVSPVGSIGRNPISLLLGEDHILGTATGAVRLVLAAGCRDDPILLAALAAETAVTSGGKIGLPDTGAGNDRRINGRAALATAHPLRYHYALVHTGRRHSPRRALPAFQGKLRVQCSLS